MVSFGRSGLNWRIVQWTLAACIAVGLIACRDDEVDDNGDVGVVDDVGEDAYVEDVGEDTDAFEEPPPECELAFEDHGEGRIFSFGSKISVDHAETYESYEDYFRGQVRQIELCLSDDRPNLLIFPEDVGLHAGLIGSRGSQARGSDIPDAAFLQLFLNYDKTIDWIDDRHDDLDLELPRRIFLGLTDTLWRAVDATFSGIAADYGVWVLTSANLAYVEERDDADSVEVWADPDLEEVDSVFVPVDEKVYNSAFIYDPDGELIARVDKPFLTSTEEEALALSYGSLEDLRPVEVGPFSFGVFTSKDAWMPPMNDRLGLLGADVQVQPEAFSGWTITQIEDQEEWLPDVLTQSGWAAVQKYPTFRYGVMPVLTGNFVGMSFDGQSVIWGQAHPGVEWGRFVGQEERPGFLEVGPWAFADPIEDDPELSLEQRREALRELGEAMLPGAGDPHENAYVDSVVARDLLGTLDYEEVGELDRSPEIDSFVVTGPQSFDETPVQRVRLAARDEMLALSWQAGERVESVLKRWDADDGHYSDQILRFGAGAQDASQIAPVVALRGEEAVVLSQRVFAEQSSLGGMIRGELEDEELPADPVDLSSLDDGQDVWLPAMSADGDRIALVFTERSTGHDRVYLSMSEDGGQSFGEAVAVDGPAEVDPPNTRGIQWHPDVAISGDTIVVVWTDFRNFQWDLYATFSLDGGDTWAETRRIDGAGDDFERLHTDPRVVLADEETAIVAWTYQADRRPDTDARYRIWDLSEDELADSVVLDSPSETYPTQAWLPAVAPYGDGVAAAWMEMVDDTPYIAVKVPGHDDTLIASHPGRAAWWPDLVVVDDRVVVSWVEHQPGVGYEVRLGLYLGSGE